MKFRRGTANPRLNAPKAMACIAGVGIFKISAFLAARPEERMPLRPLRLVMRPVRPKIIDERDGIL